VEVHQQHKINTENPPNSKWNGGTAKMVSSSHNTEIPYNSACFRSCFSMKGANKSLKDSLLITPTSKRVYRKTSKCIDSLSQLSCCSIYSVRDKITARICRASFPLRLSKCNDL
jgi:hypothetical protein